MQKVTRGTKECFRIFGPKVVLLEGCFNACVRACFVFFWPLLLPPSRPPLFEPRPAVDPQVAGEPLINTAGAHHYQRGLPGSDPRRASRQVVSGARQRRRSPSEKVPAPRLEPCAPTPLVNSSLGAPTCVTAQSQQRLPNGFFCLFLSFEFLSVEENKLTRKQKSRRQLKNTMMRSIAFNY